MRQIFVLLAAIALISACKSDSSKTKAPSSKDLEENINTLTKFPKSVAYNDAMISNMSYKDGRFSFDVTGSNYELGAQTPDAPSKMCANSAKGQHVHVIVDNDPYAAKYTSDFEFDIADGNHNLLAFLSRSYHESIKTKKAHIVQNITVKDGSIVDTENITKPALFYSRPKGTYVGKDTEKVMLDFYLVNANLGEKYVVEATINGDKFQLNTWQPYFLEELPMGENKITLRLLENGRPLSGPQTEVTRIFTLREDPTPGN